ncbi:hypothetical protein QAD02_009876 [Eretmocerus hayati]|uniref:Uncharacterized protein n=1 Tax=Eretmocerus hayati TaxID=131215 RepID=A0ACC2NAP4_9HYME|nr:hypothetical protein QAD02_009876 [Eretmocerus hayati]
MALAQQPQGSASTPAAAAAAGAAMSQDPSSYIKLREAFIRDLRHFHDTKGTSFKHKPKINGKEVDLFRLYTVVTSRGGWVQVNNRNEWSYICEEFHLPSGCVNSSVGLKQIYLRYLDRYEKVHFLGEDGNQGDDNDEDSRHRKWNVKSLHCVPLTYNHNQHNVAESLREYNGLSSNLYKPSNYDKLALSLLSPLPNEQDFAINVCTFLSNEGKHTLRLDKYPRLINHLLAHAGVFDAPGTRQLFIESYSRVRNYSMNSFWQDVLDTPDVLDLTDERAFIVSAQKAAICKNGKKKDSLQQQQQQQQQQQGSDGAGANKAKRPEQVADSVGLDSPMDVDFIAPSKDDKPDNGIEVPEERSAAPDLLFADETSCSSSISSGFRDQNQNSIKFEDDDKDLFCVGRTLGTQDPYGQRVLQIASILRNLSFTPENAAILGRSPNFLRFVLLCTRARWSNLHQLGFDTLGNIANEIVLKEIGQRLTKVVLDCVSKGISSQDRFVVISCLEVLNKISQQDLNEETLTLGLDDNVYQLICRFLALSDIALLVHTLECLYALTSLVQPVQQIQVQQPSPAPKVASTTTGGGSSRPSTPKNSASKAANSLQQQHAHQQIIQENEQFALSWLKSNFELAPGIRIEQEELYKKYLGSCTKIGRRGVIAPLHFPRCVRSVFGGTIGPNSIKGGSSGTLYYEGIKVRPTPVQVITSAQNVVSSTTVNPQASSGNDSSTSSLNPESMVQQAHQRSIDSLAQSPMPSSPILKAHLSAPPRQSVSSIISPLKSLSPVTGETKSQVTVGGDCMQAAAAPTASVSAITNTQVVTSVSANQLVTASQVAQRQQQQQQQRQQQIQAQLITSGVQPGTIPAKAFINAKTKQIVTVKKLQRINGAKLVVSNNCEKSEPMDTDSTSQPSPLPSFVIGDVNHRQQQSPTNALGKPQRNASTPTVEDSDSTNNSLASSSGIGGSRDCSGMGAEEDISLTSFEGLLNGAPSNTDIEGQEDGSSKDSSSAGLKDKVPMQSIMLADLLEKKADKEPMVNGVLGKKDLVENHIKQALKEEPPDDAKIKIEPVLGNVVVMPLHVAGIKRSASTSDESVDSKKPKYANGTNSSGPATPSPQVKPEETEDEKEEKVTVSSTAANLYAALAADIISEEDLVDTMEDIKPVIKEEVIVKEEPVMPVASPAIVQQSQPAQIQVQQPQQQGTHQVAMTHQQLQHQIQQGLIVAAGSRQIVVAQQALQSNNQMVVHPGQVKNAAAVAATTTRPATQTQQVLQVQQNPGGQTHYVIAGGVPGQNYVLAQPQTALVQGQAQTVLVAQQQGTNAKTIIILQPQAAAQQQTQKVLAMTPQGQQVVVTQVQRQLLQGSGVTASAPPPLVSSAAGASQSVAVANNTVVQQQPQVAQSNPIAIVQTQQQASAVPSRVATPTPTTTPPPSRPMTPQQQPVMASATKQTHNPVLVKDTKDIKVVATSTEIEKDSAGNSGKSGGNRKSSKAQHNTQSTSTTGSSSSSRSQAPTTSGNPSSSVVSNVPKTITIKYDPQSFLCEWRGCLKQFKSPRKVFMHACEVHCPTGSEEVICLWASCDTLKRRRFSLMAHLSDKHCNDEEMWKRRKQLATSGKTEIATTTAPTPTAHHPGYAPNAAFHAIKRHALEFVNPKELMQRPPKPAAMIASSSTQRSGQNPPPEQDDNEGPVTKSIRLTAALILRNLVIYSAHGRRHLRAYEPHLAGVALSNVESSRTIAQVLYDMNDQGSSGHR